MIKIITESGEWKEVQDISVYAETADADKVYLIKIKFETDAWDYDEIRELTRLVSKTFANENLHNIVLAEPKGIEFEIYELEKEKKKNDIKSKTRTRVENSR